MKKPHYLILANVMLKQDNMSTVAELVALSGFDFSQVDSQITTLKFRSEYRLLVDKRGKKHKYGLKIAGGERGRDFVTELFTGRVTRAIELSRHILKCENV